MTQIQTNETTQNRHEPLFQDNMKHQQKAHCRQKMRHHQKEHRYSFQRQCQYSVQYISQYTVCVRFGEGQHCIGSGQHRVSLYVAVKITVHILYEFFSIIVFQSHSTGGSSRESL